MFSFSWFFGNNMEKKMKQFCEKQEEKEMGESGEKTKGVWGAKLASVFQTPSHGRGCRRGTGRETWSLAVRQCNILQPGWRNARSTVAVEVPGPCFISVWVVWLQKSLAFPPVPLYKGQGKQLLWILVAHHTLMYAMLSRKNKLSWKGNGEL